MSRQLRHEFIMNTDSWIPSDDENPLCKRGAQVSRLVVSTWSCRRTRVTRIHAFESYWDTNLWRPSRLAVTKSHHYHGPHRMERAQLTRISLWPLTFRCCPWNSDSTDVLSWFTHQSLSKRTNVHQKEQTMPVTYQPKIQRPKFLACGHSEAVWQSMCGSCEAGSEQTGTVRRWTSHKELFPQTVTVCQTKPSSNIPRCDSDSVQVGNSRLRI